MSVAEAEIDTGGKLQHELAGTVREYHERSKHRFSGYAKGPAALDWESQPNPFRIYDGADTINLPLDECPDETKYADVIRENVAAQNFTLHALSKMLRLAFGITAWKELPDGTRWALRANPSSGNLHPTEAWVLIFGAAELKSGLYHYDSYQHALQLRCEWPAQPNAELQLYVALSTIYWREAWKYGERAFRYCHLDVGHAVSALGFACAALGWRAQFKNISSDDLDVLLGLTRDEHASVEEETASCLLQIQINQTSTSAQTHILMPRDHARIWQGIPNRLDLKPLYKWPAIMEIAAATRVLSVDHDVAELFLEHALAQNEVAERNSTDITQSWLTAENVVVLRRSAQAYDANYLMPSEHFIEMLSAFLETQWQTLLHAHPHVHLIFAVHRVQDIVPGIYVLARSAGGEALMRAQLTRWNEWVETDIAIGSHKLFRIKTTNAQRASATLCCQQAIASDCNFITGFLAEFDGVVENSSNYLALFQESGSLAHAAYLRATALGLAGTGIGCFFDDEWHELLGIKNTTLQFVYHFATGKPLLDRRLIQRTRYFHLQHQTDRFARRFT
ncbi:MAG: hypothetical protein QM709_12815 [Spongiibacteraceae bacterium]